MPACNPPCGGFADYAAVPCPNPDCTEVPEVDDLPAQVVVSALARTPSAVYPPQAVLVDQMVHQLAKIPDVLDSEVLRGWSPELGALIALTLDAKNGYHVPILIGVVASSPFAPLASDTTVR